MTPRRPRFCILLTLASCAIGCATAQPSSSGSVKVWPASAGQLEHQDFEAHLVSASHDEVAAMLGPPFATAPELAVVLTLVKNRTRADPVRVDPATVRLKLKSGEVLTPLPRGVVQNLAEGMNCRMPNPALLGPLEAKKGEARAAAAVFKLPPGADASSAEAEMQVDLGADGQHPVTSRLF